MGELVAAQVLPDILDGIEFRGVRRQHQERDVFGNDKIVALVPAGAVQDENGMGAREVEIRGGLGAAIGQAACGGIAVRVSSSRLGVKPAMPSICM